MTSPLLPGNFASQSSVGRLTLSQAVEHRRTIVGLVEADRYPASGRLYLPDCSPRAITAMTARRAGSRGPRSTAR